MKNDTEPVQDIPINDGKGASKDLKTKIDSKLEIRKEEGVTSSNIKQLVLLEVFTQLCVNHHLPVAGYLTHVPHHHCLHQHRAWKVGTKTCIYVTSHNITIKVKKKKKYWNLVSLDAIFLYV